ncbi:MAG: phospholipid-binding protein MlaC [Desulfovibrionaceae bacterium]
MKKSVFSVVALLGLLLTSGLAQAGVPTDTVRTGLDKLIAIVHDPRYTEAKLLGEDQVRQLSGAVAEFFDYGELTKRAVGPAWRGFTDAEREELTSTFRTLLEKTYIKKLEKSFLDELKAFSTDSVRFNDEKVKPPFAMVFTTFLLKDKQIEVNFRLIDKQGKWMVYDIIGEGLTLLGVYKDDFQAALAKMTPEEFVVQLQNKIKDVEAGKLEDETLLDTGAPTDGKGGSATQPAAQ